MPKLKPKAAPPDPSITNIPEPVIKSMLTLCRGDLLRDSPHKEDSNKPTSKKENDYAEDFHKDYRSAYTRLFYIINADRRPSDYTK